MRTWKIDRLSPYCRIPLAQWEKEPPESAIGGFLEAQPLVQFLAAAKGDASNAQGWGLTSRFHQTSTYSGWVFLTAEGRDERVDIDRADETCGMDGWLIRVLQAYRQYHTWSAFFDVLWSTNEGIYRYVLPEDCLLRICGSGIPCAPFALVPVLSAIRCYQVGRVWGLVQGLLCAGAFLERAQTAERPDHVQVQVTLDSTVETHLGLSRNLFFCVPGALLVLTKR